MPDPLAIQIGSTISTGLEGTAANTGMAFTDPASFYNIVTDQKDPVDGSRAGKELDFIRGVGDQILKFATPVRNAANKAKNLSTLYPAAKQNTLSDQLQIVARLIAGGLKTRIYIVGLGGFDTHSNQNSGGAGTPVPHGTLLNQVSVAIEAFQDDLRLLGVEDRVVGMTFSEFGRRIKSNSSGGTDHGAAAPLFVFGTNVIPGVLGANPTIPTSVTAEDNIPMQFDFRSVYASILKDWFKVDDDELRTVLFRDFQILPIIKGTSSGVDSSGRRSRTELRQNYPNPIVSSARIPFIVDGGRTWIGIFDNTGRRLFDLVDRDLPAGDHEVVFDVDGLPSGTYYCRLQCGNEQRMIRMTVTK